MVWNTRSVARAELVLLLVLPWITPAPAADNPYRASIEKWHQEREAKLRADDGWLALAGLFWLKDGANRFGTDPTNDIVLPAGSAPARVGVFEFHGGRAIVRVASGVTVTLDGKPVTTRELRSDQPGPPDVIAVANLTLYGIQRGTRYGIRLKDKDSRTRKEFAGVRSFPIDEVYRVTARFVPYEPAKMISIPNILGDVEQTPSPGYAVFTLQGRECRLDAVTDEGNLFFIFRDLTSGKETYPAGRFLDADPPKDGKVTLDFNKAYNPPCAFTPYATCPLPPRQNHLPARIEAGERNYHH